MFCQYKEKLRFAFFFSSIESQITESSSSFFIQQVKINYEQFDIPFESNAISYYISSPLIYQLKVQRLLQEMLKYWKRTNLLAIIKPQNHLWNCQKSHHINFINFYSSRVPISFKYCFSTFSKRNPPNPQKKTKKTEHHNKSSENKNSGKGKQQRYNKEKRNANNNVKHQKNKDQPQKPQNVDQNSQQQKYEMSPDILQFNTEITTFINSHITQLKTPSIKSTTQQQQQIPQNKQITITTNFLSNLYKFINLKGDFLEVDPQRSLSPQNKRRIGQFIKGKERSQNLEELVKNEKSLMIYHEELCNTMYLSSIVSEKKRFGNVLGEFLALLGMRERLVDSGKQVRFRFVMSVDEQQKTLNNPTSRTLNLPIIVSNLCPPTLYLLHDTFPLQIIKAITESGTAQKLLGALRCLSKLLTIKQLKTLDGLIDEKFLNVTEYWMKKKYQEGKGVQMYEEAGISAKVVKNNVLTLMELSRLASILSQLNLNGSSIKSCQRIFSLILQKQSQTLTQVMQTLTQQLSSLQATSELTLSFVINLPLTEIKFDMLIKFYIALAQIGAVDKEFGYLVERVIVGKLELGEVMERNRDVIKDINVWRQLSSRYCLNSKEISILLSTMHKFKKGSEIIMTAKNKAGTNIWIQVHNYYTSNSNTLPQQFAFPILSGLYRSHGSMVVNQFSGCFEKEQTIKRLQRMNSMIGKLSMRLYQADKSLGYLQQLQLQKLIQLALVVNFSANVEIVNVVNQRMLVKGKPSSIMINLQYEFVNKLLEQLKERMQKEQNGSGQQQFKQNQQQQQHDYDPINPQLAKQQKAIQSMLSFYLLMTKAKLQLFRTSNTKGKAPYEPLSLILKQIKSTLKQSKINPQTSQLITLMIKNDIKLSNYMKEKDSTIEASRELQTFANNMQSFIGFNSEKEVLEYERQLQANLIKTVFPYLQDEADQGVIQIVIKRFLGTSNADFFTEKLLINNTMIEQQIIRINLIQGQEDYKMYSTHSINAPNQLDQ